MSRHGELQERLAILSFTRESGNDAFERWGIGTPHVVIVPLDEGKADYADLCEEAERSIAPYEFVFDRGADAGITEFLHALWMDAPGVFLRDDTESVGDPNVDAAYPNEAVRIVKVTYGDKLYAALSKIKDAELLEDKDLVESLNQMRRGEGEVVRERPQPPEAGSEYRSAWTVEQEDGSLITLHGAVNSNIEEVEEEVAEVKTLSYVMDAWVEASKWKRQ